jgi:hypothetical protein
MAPMGYSGDRGNLNQEKKQSSKISCHTFFNLKVLSYEKLDGLKVVSIDVSRFQLVTPRIISISLDTLSCEKPKTTD